MPRRRAVSTVAPTPSAAAAPAKDYPRKTLRAWKGVDHHMTAKRLAAAAGQSEDQLYKEWGAQYAAHLAEERKAKAAATAQRRREREQAERQAAKARRQAVAGGEASEELKAQHAADEAKRERRNEAERARRAGPPSGLYTVTVKMTITDTVRQETGGGKYVQRRVSSVIVHVLPPMRKDEISEERVKLLALTHNQDRVAVDSYCIASEVDGMTFEMHPVDKNPRSLRWINLRRSAALPVDGDQAAGVAWNTHPDQCLPDLFYATAQRIKPHGIAEDGTALLRPLSREPREFWVGLLQEAVKACWTVHTNPEGEEVQYDPLTGWFTVDEDGVKDKVMDPGYEPLHHGFNCMHAEWVCKRVAWSLLAVDCDCRAVLAYDPPTKKPLATLCFRVENEHVYPIFDPDMKRRVRACNGLYRDSDAGRQVLGADPKQGAGVRSQLINAAHARSRRARARARAPDDEHEHEEDEAPLAEEEEPREVKLVVHENVQDSLAKLGEILARAGKLSRPGSLWWDGKVLRAVRLGGELHTINNDTAAAQAVFSKMGVPYRGEPLMGALKHVLKATGTRVPLSSLNPHAYKALVDSGMTSLQGYRGIAPGYTNADFLRLANAGELEALDVGKCYPTVMWDPPSPWMQFMQVDQVAPFDGDFTQLGLYMVEAPAPAGLMSVLHGSGWYCDFTLVKAAAEGEAFKVLRQYRPSKRAPRDLLRPALTEVMRLADGDAGAAKAMLSPFNGLFGRTHGRYYSVRLDSSFAGVQAWLAKRDVVGLPGVVLHDFEIPGAGKYYLYGYRNEFKLAETALPMYLQILQAARCHIYDMMRAMGGRPLAAKVDCVFALKKDLPAGVSGVRQPACANPYGWGCYRDASYVSEVPVATVKIDAGTVRLGVHVLLSGEVRVMLVPEVQAGVGLSIDVRPSGEARVRLGVEELVEVKEMRRVVDLPEMYAAPEQSTANDRIAGYKDAAWVRHDHIIDSNQWEELLKLYLEKGSLLVEGGPGVGKSYVAQKIIDSLPKGSVAVLAFTHSACEILDGQTIDSFLRMDQSDPEEKKLDAHWVNLLRAGGVRHIIVDEASMVGMGHQIRVALVKKGIKAGCLVFGDSEQCPPVEPSRPTDIEHYFNHPTFMDLAGHNRVELTVNHRCDPPLRALITGQAAVEAVNPFRFPNQECAINICRDNQGRRVINLYFMRKLKPADALHVPADRYDSKAEELWVWPGAPLVAHVNKYGKVEKGVRLPIIGRRPTMVYNMERFEVAGFEEAKDEEEKAKGPTVQCRSLRDGHFHAVPLAELNKVFQPGYCLTVYRAQGKTIDAPLCLWQWERMSWREKRTAMSRATKLDNINYRDWRDTCMPRVEMDLTAVGKSRIKGYFAQDTAAGYHLRPGWAEKFITVQQFVAAVKACGERCTHCKCDLNCLAMKDPVTRTMPGDAVSVNRLNNTPEGGGHVWGNWVISCYHCNCSHAEENLALE